jgi:hypothetical protein
MAGNGATGSENDVLELVAARIHPVENCSSAEDVDYGNWQSTTWRRC